MKESRKYARRATSEYLLVKNLSSGLSIGRVADISPKGLLLLGTEELSVGDTYQLGVELPKDAFERKIIELTAVCRWSIFERRSDVWKSGFEMTEMSIENRRVLQQLVIRLMSHNGECRDVSDAVQIQKHDKVEYVRVRRYR